LSCRYASSGLTWTVSEQTRSRRTTGRTRRDRADVQLRSLPQAPSVNVSSTPSATTAARSATPRP
jgi:hypothetical protein